MKKALKKWGNKAFCLFLAAALLISAAPVSRAATPFTDVSSKAWYAGAVEYVYQNKLFQGEMATRFNPGAPMTRAMFAQVLANNTQGAEPQDAGVRFQDVKPGDWYYKAVTWAKERAIVKGVEENRFDPNGKITREQMVTMLYAYAMDVGADTSVKSDRYNDYYDFIDTSGWAQIPMAWALEKGIINGTSPTTLSPKALAQRCEVAQIFRNARSLLPPGSASVEAKSSKDPDLPLLRTLGLTHRQLSAWGIKETGGLSVNNKNRAYVYRFLQDLTFWVPYGSDEDDSLPVSVDATLDQVFPQLEGVSLGAAYRYFGRNRVTYFYNPAPRGYFGYYTLAYQTDNYLFLIYMSNELAHFTLKDRVQIFWLNPEKPALYSGEVTDKNYLECLDMPLYQVMSKYGITPDDSYGTYSQGYAWSQVLDMELNIRRAPTYPTNKKELKYEFFNYRPYYIFGPMGVLLPELVGTPVHESVCDYKRELPGYEKYTYIINPIGTSREEYTADFMVKVILEDDSAAS